MAEYFIFALLFYLISVTENQENIQFKRKHIGYVQKICVYKYYLQFATYLDVFREKSVSKQDTV